MKKAYILYGSIVIILIIIASALIVQRSREKKANLLSINTSSMSIQKMAPGAFGTLNANPNNNSNPISPSQSEIQSNEDMLSPDVSMPASVSGSAGLKNSMAIMRPYYPYKYVYAGKDLPEIPKQMDVYEKVANANRSAALQAAGILSNLNFGVANLSSFDSAAVDSFTINQDQQFGYSITVDVQNGTININRNWQQWPDPLAQCNGDQTCIQNNRIKIGDIPSDDKIIAVTNSFIKEHNINTKLYGQPEVSKNWRIPYDSASPAAKSQIYLPEIISVTYPLQMNGNDVYASGGNKAGLTVNYDIRFNKVDSLYGLSAQNYESSAYATETDPKILIKYAEGGEQNSGGPIIYNNQGIAQSAPGVGSVVQPNAKLETVDLATPFIAYEQTWNYQNSQNKEIYVPALVFAVTNVPQNYYGPKAIVVPLIKDILEGNSNNPPIMHPMSNSAPASGSAAASSSGFAVPQIKEVLPK